MTITNKIFFLDFILCYKLENAMLWANILGLKDSVTY